MTENMDKWPSRHRKTKKSGHRLAAEKTLFPRRWYGGMFSANLEVIWEMSDESFAAHWPSVDNDPHADILNDATKFVATSTLSKLEWKNSTRIAGDIAAQVSRLKDEEGPLLQVHGSWQLIQTLLSHELIDEFRLWTFPLVVGPGKRLFGRDTVPTDLTLIKTKTTSNGVTMSIYRRAGTLRRQS